MYSCQLESQCNEVIVGKLNDDCLNGATTLEVEDI